MDLRRLAQCYCELSCASGRSTRIKHRGNVRSCRNNGRRKACPTTPGLKHRIVDAPTSCPVESNLFSARPASTSQESAESAAKVTKLMGVGNFRSGGSTSTKNWHFSMLAERGERGFDIGKGGRLLLPGASRTAGIPFCCPVGSDRAFVHLT